jgi:hypothetical protein
MIQLLSLFLNCLLNSAQASVNYPRDMPPIGEILREVRASYLMSIPGLGNPLTFHSFRLGYQINARLRMGFGGDLSQSADSGARTWYDPYLYVELPGTGSAPIPYTTLSVSVPVTPASREARRITSVAVSQFWSFSEAASAWQFGGHYTLNPVFEYDPPSDGAQDRQQFFFSVGHSIVYRVSDHWSLSSRSSFQLEHRRSLTPESPFLQVPFPETHQLGLTWSPIVSTLRVSVGASLQTDLFHPQARTSRIGGQLALGF